MNVCQSFRTQKALIMKQKEKINQLQKKEKQTFCSSKETVTGGFLPCLFAQENMSTSLNH